MSDPKRLLSGDLLDLERDLLRSAEVLDVAPRDGKDRAYALIGGMAIGGAKGPGGTGAGGAAGAGGATATKVGSGIVSGSIAPKAATVSAVVIMKWISIPVIIGAATLAGAHIERIRSASVQTSAAPQSQTQTSVPTPAAAIQAPPAPSSEAVTAAPIAQPIAAVIAPPIANPPQIAASPAIDAMPRASIKTRVRKEMHASTPAPMTTSSELAVTTTSTPVATNASPANPTTSNAVATNPLVSNPPPAPPLLTASELRQETTSLEHVLDLVHQGRSTDALRALDECDARFGGRGPLVQEFAVVRIEALSANGDRAAAASLARRFLAENPTSSHRDFVRALLENNTP